MASTYINHLKDYYQRVADHPGRSNVLTIGDSWFQYPLRFYPDIQTRLSSDDVFGRRSNILDDSHPGREASAVKQKIASWSNVAAYLQDKGKPFRAILVSLGGNDVVGLEFRDHVREQAGMDNSAWPWSPAVPPVVRTWIRLDVLAATFQSIADNYRRIIAMRDMHAPDGLIVTHTYADVTPMNKPYVFKGFGVRMGPWIWPYLAPLGLSDAERKEIIRWMLASFHGLLVSLKAETHDFEVLDTRLELPDLADWDNELHPLGPGFVHLADKFWYPLLDPVL